MANYSVEKSNIDGESQVMVDHDINLI